MGVLSVSMGHQSSGLLLPLPSPLVHIPGPCGAWGLGICLELLDLFAP